MGEAKETAFTFHCIPDYSVEVPLHSRTYSVGDAVGEMLGLGSMHLPPILTLLTPLYSYLLLSYWPQIPHFKLEAS